MNKLDLTPEDYVIKYDSLNEKIKKPVRRYLYPIYIFFTTKVLSFLFHKKLDFDVDVWLFNQRGNDYERHRRRVDDIFDLENKKLLLAGCGLGYDFPTWLPYNLKQITGVDYFSYDKAWQTIINDASEKHPKTKITFEQLSLEDMKGISNSSFDIVASDAVFEHIKNMDIVLDELYRVLKPGGLMYATFGPLWNCFHGDHISGYDSAENGYNHLILSPDEYSKYLDAMGSYSHTPHDGRTWIDNDLFSYLKPIEYISYLEKAGFIKKYIVVLISSEGMSCLKDNKQLKEKLLSQHDYIDLIVEGMTVIYTKPT